MRFTWLALLLGACDGSINSGNVDAPAGGDAPIQLDAPMPTTVGAFGVKGTMGHRRAGNVSVILKDRLYVIGGNLCESCKGGLNVDLKGNTDNVESASVNDLTTWRNEQLAKAFRQSANAFALSRAGHDYIYVLGGVNATGAGGTDVYPTTIERAELSGGSLSAFLDVTSTLQAGRAGATLIVQGDDVFVLGGMTAAGPVSSIEHATIDGNGNLGPFSTATQTLAVESAFHGVVLTSNNDVMLFGGIGAGGTALAGVQQGKFASGAFMANFDAVPAATSELKTPRAAATTLVLENKVFVFGGGDGTTAALASTEAATLSPIGAFANGPTMFDQPRNLATAHLINAKYCVVGGVTSGKLDPLLYPGTIACAPLQ